MSVLAVTNPTLLDFKATLDGNDRVTRIIEILSQKAPILTDAVTLEGNLLTGNKTTIRTGLPTPTWRKLYGGVQPSKATNVAVTDTCGMLEGYSEVDVALADLNSNAAAFRMTEDKAFLEAMMQEVAGTLFYGNEGLEPEAFTGLSPRYNSITNAENAQNTLTASGSGSDNCSLWLTVWGENSNFLFYPKGSKAGFTHKDMGEVTVENVDGAGGRAQMYRSHYRWDVGLAVRDWRQNVRICNIDVSELTKDATSGADLYDLIAQAMSVIHDINDGRAYWYGNRTIESFLRRQLVNKVKNSTLSMDMVAGREVVTIAGVPFHRCDALSKAETVVPA